MHIKAILQEMPQPSIAKICLKTKYPKFHSNFPGANELIKDGYQVNSYDAETRMSQDNLVINPLYATFFQREQKHIRPNEVGEGLYWIHLVRPSVHPSVCRRHRTWFPEHKSSFLLWNFNLKFHMHIDGGPRQEPIDFQRRHFQNGRLAAILDFLVSGL